MFLANVSHEIRTPLNSIIGFAHLMEPLVKTKQEINFIQSILISSNSLLSLINDILDLSKIQAGKLELIYEPVYLPKIVREIRQIFYPQVEAKNLDFNIKIEKTAKNFFQIDASRFRQILFNIIGNAIKFTDHGSINVSIAAKPTKGQNDSYDFKIKVTDTGSGIPKDEQSVIFDAFKQAAGDDEVPKAGTGLGLNISQRLVEMMSGRIELKSEVGKGSEFIILLFGIKSQNPEKGKQNNPELPDLEFQIDNENKKDQSPYQLTTDAEDQLVKLFEEPFIHVMKHKIISEIGHFGESLLDYAETQKIESLADDCRTLIEASQRIDIEIIDRILYKIQKYFRFK